MAGRRLTNMMTDVFGSPPLVMSLPYVERIGPDDAQVNRITFPAGRRAIAVARRIRQQFAGRFF